MMQAQIVRWACVEKDSAQRTDQTITDIISGGESRIRTSELKREQIYSLRALATCISHQ